MKAVILGGGFGTRLRPLTINTPKSMVPVLNIPFLEYVITRLKYHDIKEIALAVSYLSQPIKDYFGDGKKFGVSLEYTVEDSPLGTAGAVKNAGNFFNTQAVVLNGDIFTDLDLTDMIVSHKRNKAKVTIALTPVEDPTSYGLVETDSAGRVSRFLEKPKAEEITTNMINAGTYIIEPEVIALIPPQTNYSFERELFPLLLKNGEPVYAYPSSCYWLDIGRPVNYLQLHNDLLNGKSNQFSFKNGNIVTGNRYSIHPTAEITGHVVIGNNCTIGEGVRIKGNTVIGSNCHISNYAVIEDSTLWDSVYMEPMSKVRNSIIANNCHIGSGSLVEGAVLGNNAIITYGYHVKTGSLISPESIVS